MEDKWILRPHMEKELKVILSLSKLLEKISKNSQNRLFIGAFCAEAVSEGFSEEDIYFFICFMLWKGALKYIEKREGVVEYIKKDVECVEKHKERITRLARWRMSMQKEFEEWRELGLKNGFEGEIAKNYYDCLYELENIKNEIHYAILNMLLDERRKKSKRVKCYMSEKDTAEKQTENGLVGIGHDCQLPPVKTGGL